MNIWAVCLSAKAVSKKESISHHRKPLDISKMNRLFSAKQSGKKIKGCVYCDKEDHKSIQCKAVTDTNKRRKILSEKTVRNLF